MAEHRLSKSISGDASASEDLRTLKYHLLGPSLTKAGQDKVDQSKVSEIIYDASKGTKFFKREQTRDRNLTEKIGRILMRKRELEKQNLTRDLRNADKIIAELELSRDLTQNIVHVDCDAFYAAVEQLERPELKTLPFAVGSGVLTTCNYVARQFGCRSGMAGFVAKKLCPDLIFIKPNFRTYTAKAHEVREVLAAYDPRFESAGIDEAYLNITDYCAANDIEPAEAVNQMRKHIQEKTCITVSAGIAANTRLAKICSNMNKPNGQYVLPNDRDSILEFMQFLPTRKVNGIGRVLERELLEIGVNTWGDVFQQRQLLCPLFGQKTSTFLLNCYLGLGRTAVHPAQEHGRKSVGTESTFVKLHTFEVLTRQRVMPRAVQLADEIYSQALPMFYRLREEYPDLKLRLMGLRCTHLVSTKKPDTMAFLGFKRRKLVTEDDQVLDGAKAKSDQNCADMSPVSHGSRSDGTDGGGLGLSSTTDIVVSVGYTLASDEHCRGVCEEKNDWWDCPICLRPQPVNEQQVNEHIDSCLSRQAVRDAARDVDEGKASSTLSEHKIFAPLDRKKRKIPIADPKQKKLSFG
ncbi:dna polymerase kappa subunit [Ophiocordyceps camponoti-floridani]|uniref:DNA polymerase kappa n=1 Tax=Ophiocordyceps camponoti-floridani TaxID=2030778 RepID=A0A8H4Q7R5_9HYPO|nr:dna polymerase kappa subunit [Ophiocordyceps camponoti-floridani]